RLHCQPPGSRLSRCDHTDGTFNFTGHSAANGPPFGWEISGLGPRKWSLFGRSDRFAIKIDSPRPRRIAAGGVRRGTSGKGVPKLRFEQPRSSARADESLARAITIID